MQSGRSRSKFLYRRGFPRTWAHLLCHDPERGQKAKVPLKTCCGRKFLCSADRVGFGGGSDRPTSIIIKQYQLFTSCTSVNTLKFTRERMEYFGDRRDRRTPDAKWKLAARVNL
jgi:hypothetical protein